MLYVICAVLCYVIYTACVMVYVMCVVIWYVRYVMLCAVICYMNCMLLFLYMLRMLRSAAIF